MNILLIGGAHDGRRMNVPEKHITEALKVANVTDPEEGGIMAGESRPIPAGYEVYHCMVEMFAACRGDAELEDLEDAVKPFRHSSLTPLAALEELMDGYEKKS